MKKLIVITLLCVLVPLQTSAISTTSAINAENFVELISYTSQYARIEGEICNSAITDNSKVIFLNFGKNFNTSLSAVIYDTDIPAFIDAGISEPADYFKNKKVVIEGIIRISEGKPEIVLNSPDQIKIIN